MQFEKFIKFVEPITSTPLTGTSSHKKMVPKNRVFELSNEEYIAKKTKQAAVLMLIYPKNSLAHIALIQRNEYEGVHSSQIAFPGGKYEETDLNLQETALRETFEEIGIPSEQVKIIRQFSKVYIQPSNFLVYPFLGFAEHTLNFFPDPNEVSQIIEMPISMLLDDKNLVTKTITTSYAFNITVPTFQFFNHTVWGATAMMLSELKDVLKQIE